MTLPTWDLLITLFFLVAMAFGFILGRGRIVIILIITYVAYAVAQELGTAAYSLFAGPTTIAQNVWVQGSASLFTIKCALFGLVIVLLSLKGELNALAGLARGLKSTILTGVYAFFNAGLIISCIIKFLPEETQTALFSISPLANQVASNREWWVLIPVVIMVIEGFFRGKEEVKQ